MNKIKYAEKARDSILDIVIKNFDYFRDNPKHLAWAMMKWRLVHTASRIAYGACEDNPKYPVLDAGYLLKTEADGNLLYDAWAVSCSNESEFPDTAREPNWEKLVKPNKTLDEWIDIKTDPQYRYSGMYPDEIDSNIFAGYSLAEPEVRKDIRSAINKFLNSKTLKGPTDDYMKKVEINWGDNEVKKTILNGSWKAMHALNYRPELTQQVEEAYRFIAYLDKLIKTARKWDDKQWAKASKKSTWKYKDYVLDISQVRPNCIHSPSSFELTLSVNRDEITEGDDLRFIDSILGARNKAWSDFVFATNKPPEVKKAQKVLNKMFGKKKPCKKRIENAEKLLRKHQPNYYKHIDVYTRAYEGDEKAIKKLNKLAGVPKSGWDSVKFIVEHERKQWKSFYESFDTEKKKTYYPICEYSNMITMPKNAHSSYVRAAIKVAQEIINNKEEPPPYSRKYAKKFLKQWKSYTK
jgi:hypothetical protein